MKVIAENSNERNRNFMVLRFVKAMIF